MEASDQKRVLASLVNEDSQSLGAPFDLPTDIDTEKLQQICNALLSNEDEVPFTFYVQDKEITSTLGTILDEEKVETEQVVQIVYQPQAIFKVRSVTRCTSTIPGHAEAVISVAFSPDGKFLASGSGDTTVRFWDVETETPQFTCKGHKHWVLSIAWSPDGKKLASGCKNAEIRLWDPSTGQLMGKPLTGHKQWITWLAWEPLHKNPSCRRLASSSKDGTIKIWDTVLCKVLISMSGHLQSVTCMQWGGEGLIYSGSQDRTIKVWRDTDGVLCRTLQGHGHWINTMALNTGYMLRTGGFEAAQKKNNNEDDEKLSVQDQALARYNSVKGDKPEFMVTGSDDFTMFLWQPSESKKQVARMTGHQAPINDVQFSPNGRFLASASFDKSVKLWDGTNGKFISAFRGHVNEVYQISWSADSRLLCSGSADSTLKVWNLKTKKILCDLPGHADKVFAVDWSPDGERVASGGKDKVLKMWRN
ncbi:notchless protein homolog 1-like [Clytia hemisphaerica]|uniref:NLE domain-containing protein n=1 Tax=Clytia hemisphaerica TaxID=252671 RepID=A0A7M5XHV9_9CNID